MFDILLKAGNTPDNKVEINNSCFNTFSLIVFAVAFIVLIAIWIIIVKLAEKSKNNKKGE